MTWAEKIKEWLEMAGYKMSNTKGDPSVTRMTKPCRIGLNILGTIIALTKK